MAVDADAAAGIPLLTTISPPPALDLVCGGASGESSMVFKFLASCAVRLLAVDTVREFDGSLLLPLSRRTGAKASEEGGIGEPSIVSWPTADNLSSGWTRQSRI
jgi:hypothetical protein